MEPLHRKNRGWCGSVRGIVFCVLALVVLAKTSRASLPPDTACPLDFFTNVASRLLSSEMGLDLDHIQIYPTNQYTPAVHRLLQVTANIYDATTTNYYPSVFRPVFWKTNELNGLGVWQTNLYIAGYQYVREPLTNNGEPIFAPPTDASDPSIPPGLSDTNIYGIPWVIGVKKGLPNFNGLELDNCFFIERNLEFNRNNANVAPPGTPFPYGRVYTTNQLYTVGLSNILGVDFWNSYASNYDGQVTIVVRDTFSVQLTNDASGFRPIANTWFSNAYTEVLSWPGSASASPFVLPLGTNVMIPQNLTLPPAPASADGLYLYYYGPGPTNVGGLEFNGPCFIPAAMGPTDFMDAGTPPLPHFVLTVTNRLQAYIIDSNDCVLDYVQLGDMNSSLDVNEAIADNSIINPLTQQGYTTGLWSTNFYPDGGTTPFGVVEQTLVSLVGGVVPAEDQDGGFWNSVPVAGLSGESDSSPQALQAFFTAFFSGSDEAAYNNNIVSNFDLSMLAPFTPTRLVVQRIVYAANDPLVHYLTSDLNDFADDTNSLFLDNPPLKFLAGVNPHYMPWGTIGSDWPAAAGEYDNNPDNPAYKDPLVSSSDRWNFPTNESLNASWLGQIHRGTPWQTIFLKSTNILDLTQTVGNASIPSGLNTWELWTGDTNPADAISMAPVQDWHMAALLASLFNTNEIASLFSVNDRSVGDWEGLLNGMTVLTNDLPDAVVDSPFNHSIQFAVLTISSNTAPAAAMADAIQSARAAAPGGVIAHVGDIFAVSQLSDDSPYLNTDSAQTAHGISDAAYEAIPSQLLPLLWEDSVGSVAPADGQIVFQFTGDDNHAYAIQVSSDLRTWTSVMTNCPVNGVFTFTNTAAMGPGFYRTVLAQ